MVRQDSDIDFHIGACMKDDSFIGQHGIEEKPCGGPDNQRVDAKRRDAEAKQRSTDVSYIGL
jgi:hypothetical protein